MKMEVSYNKYNLAATLKTGSLILMILAISLLMLFSCDSKTDPRKIPVTDFGAIPNDGQNDADPLRKAMDFCRQKQGVTLFLLPGCMISAMKRRLNWRMM